MSEPFGSWLPDEASQVLVIEFARSRGLNAFVPGRSRRRVVIRTRKQEADSPAAEVRPLIARLQLLHVKAVAEVLEENEVPVSPRFSSLVASLEAKANGARSGPQRKASN